MKYGLVGEKLGHSFSPEIHRAIFELAGTEGEYSLIELQKDELGSFLQNAAGQGFTGLNVTIPYKTAVIPFLDSVSAEAEKTGAVNTISFKNGIKGFNTDYYGIRHTFLKNGINAAGKKILVAGSGGAAKSVMAFLVDENAGRIFIASRNPANIAVKSESTIPVGYEEIDRYAPFDIVINTTPVGMYPNTGVSPLKPGHVRGAEFLFDLIYNPGRTELLKLAEDLRIPNENGLYMLVVQAVKAHEIWNNREYDTDFINSVYNEAKNKLGVL